MKNSKSIFYTFSIMLAIFLANISIAFAQEETSKMKVDGNCQMCKKRIETALLKNQNIKKASWDVDSKILTVSYDPKKIDQAGIQKIITEAGHDTEKLKATDAAYKKLPECCQFDRSSKN